MTGHVKGDTRSSDYSSCSFDYLQVSYQTCLFGGDLGFGLEFMWEVTRQADYPFILLMCRRLPYLGKGVASIRITPISHTITSAIPIINPVTKFP